jgi:hypothetical protein
MRKEWKVTGFQTLHPGKNHENSFDVSFPLKFTIDLTTKAQFRYIEYGPKHTRNTSRLSFRFPATGH